MNTIQQLVATSEQLDLLKHDEVLSLRNAQVTDKVWNFNNGLMPGQMTRGGLQQWASKVGYHTSRTRGRMPADWLYDDAFNEEYDFITNGRNQRALKEGRDRYTIRFIQRANGENDVRAVLGKDYPLFGDGMDRENTLMLRTLEQALSVFPGDMVEYARCHVDGDRVQFRVFAKDAGDIPGIDPKYSKSYKMGWVGGNSEVGDGGCWIYPAAFRATCSNSYTENREAGFKFAHIGGVRKFREAIIAAMLDVVPSAMALVERLCRAEEVEVNIAKEFAKFYTQFGWTDRKGNLKEEYVGRNTALISGAEGKTTLAGVAHGITHMAHSTDNDVDDQLAYELFAGRLVRTVA